MRVERTDLLERRTREAVAESGGWSLNEGFAHQAGPRRDV